MSHHHHPSDITTHDNQRTSYQNASRYAQQYNNDVLLGHKYRLSLLKPRQSYFRVVALVHFEEELPTSLAPPPPSLQNPSTTQATTVPSIPNRPDNSGSNITSQNYVVGTNDEPCHIGGSICAERAALLQLRFRPVARITRITIVSDAPSDITPGLLCREFMSSCPFISRNNVPIVLGGSCCRRCGREYSSNRGEDDGSGNSCGGDGSGHEFVHSVVTLRELYPHPSPYSRLTATESMTFGAQYKATNAVANFDDDTPLSTAEIRDLLTDIMTMNDATAAAAAKTTTRRQKERLYNHLIRIAHRATKKDHRSTPWDNWHRS